MKRVSFAERKNKHIYLSEGCNHTPKSFYHQFAEKKQLSMEYRHQEISYVINFKVLNIMFTITLGCYNTFKWTNKNFNIFAKLNSLWQNRWRHFRKISNNCVFFFKEEGRKELGNTALVPPWSLQKLNRLDPSLLPFLLQSRSWPGFSYGSSQS